MGSFVPGDRFCPADSWTGNRVTGNSIAGGEGETSSTVGATEARADSRSGTGSPDNTTTGTGAKRGRGERGWITRQCIAGTFCAGACFLFRCHGISDVALP